MNFNEWTTEILKKSITSAKDAGQLPENDDLPSINVEYPKDEKFGDTSTSFALESAKILRKSPMEIGENLKSYIAKYDVIEKVEVVKPGFINIFFSFNAVFDSMRDILVQKGTYGKIKKEKPRRVNIEFVSANPTGPLNIVSSRAAALGDTIANLLEAIGDNVEREYYINDYGNQVYNLGKSVLARLNSLQGNDTEFPEDGYHGEYIYTIAEHILKNHLEEINTINDEDDLIDYLAQKAVEYNVGTQKSDLIEFNVNFDKWFSERELHESGEVEKTADHLDNLGVLYEEDGKKLFRSTDFNDDKDRVVIRDDGRPTYLLADIAYHRDKIKRGYDLIIDIWGPDHHGYVARMAGAMKVLGYDSDRFRILIAQQVNLVTEGEIVKMSKRLGNFSTMKALIDEIGFDVARYFFVMRSLESHLDFDLTLAKKESSENPVFYLQYAHARICSIFREAVKRDISYEPEGAEMEFLNNYESVTLMKLMLKFPEEIKSSAESLEPHRITTYLMKLAQAFHKFYTEHRVLSDNSEKTNTYLMLADAVRIVLKNGLSLLGVPAPEQM